MGNFDEKSYYAKCRENKNDDAIDSDSFYQDFYHIFKIDDSIFESKKEFYIHKCPIIPIIKRKQNNIIKKINAFFINKYIIDLIKKNSIKNDISLKKLSHIFIYKLNKRNTERLLEMKISDILIEQDISSKYTNYVKDYNRHLIDKIYEEKKEIKVIKILELTFEELFIIFRRKLNDPNDINKLEEIKDKIKGLDLLEENNKYKDIEYFIQEEVRKNIHNMEYIEEIKKTCLEYDKRFKTKII